MTRAIDRLIVSGSLDLEKPPETRTPIGWVLDRLGGVEPPAEGETLEIERGEARLLFRRSGLLPDAVPAEPALTEAEEAQLALFSLEGQGSVEEAEPPLPPLVPLAEPPLHDPRRLSYSALALFSRCSYRYFAERVVGMRPADVSGRMPGRTGLAATEIGDAVHGLLERVDLAAPGIPEGDALAEAVRSRYPGTTEEELARIEALARAYCDSSLAARVAALAGAASERPFAFEHDGVLLHGRLDVLHLADGRALVVDFKTNMLDGASPAEVIDGEYRVQRLVYALACFRAGAEEVEVVYQFLERPDEPVSSTFSSADAPSLEAELSTEIDRIREGRFVPTPSEMACSGCPALDVVCAGPRLRSFAA
jgi:ATP-dependent helicase/nuclease subunit A